MYRFPMPLLLFVQPLSFLPLCWDNPGIRGEEFGEPCYFNKLAHQELLTENCLRSLSPFHLPLTHHMFLHSLMILHSFSLIPLLLSLSFSLSLAHSLSLSLSDNSISCCMDISESGSPNIGYISELSRLVKWKYGSFIRCSVVTVSVLEKENNEYFSFSEMGRRNVYFAFLRAFRFRIQHLFRFGQCPKHTLGVSFLFHAIYWCFMRMSVFCVISGDNGSLVLYSGH